MLIEAAISGDRNVLKKKESKKIRKYTDLTTEIQCICSVKTKAIPVITGANGTISKYLSNKPGKHIKKVQKKCHIGHCIHTSVSTNKI
jgi:hypothetical protein